MKYLFSAWDELRPLCQKAALFLFMDYDGTLAPIAETPAEAKILPENKKILEELSNVPDIKLAIISGRAMGDIKSRVGLKNIIYAANHGLEIDGPKIKFKSPIGPNFRKTIKSIYSGLKDRLAEVKGVLIEDKELSLSLHYRLVKKAEVPKVKAVSHELMIIPLVQKKLRVTSGKKVLEVRPRVEWDKGKVTLWLLARQQFAQGSKKVLPVYIGDDLTDEDAFKVLRNKGITIAVGKASGSYAQFYLEDAVEVGEFLKRIKICRI